VGRNDPHSEAGIGREGRFAAGAFGGSVITFGVLVLFDNWLWPERAETRLMESLGASLARMNARFREAASYYLEDAGAARRRFRLPPPIFRRM
jgi:hypothetical protein